VLELRPQIQHQVEHGLGSLSAEFASEVSPEAIWSAGNKQLSQFLARARFDDFIAVLVYRTVREAILAQSPAGRPPIPAR
jgi:hypothetical protein